MPSSGGSQAPEFYILLQSSYRPDLKKNKNQVGKRALSNCPDAVTRVQVPNKQSPEKVSLSWYIFFGECLAAPATAQCPSEATQDSAPLPYCFNFINSWIQGDYTEGPESPGRNGRVPKCIQRQPQGAGLSTPGRNISLVWSLVIFNISTLML